MRTSQPMMTPPAMRVPLAPAVAPARVPIRLPALGVLTALGFRLSALPLLAEAQGNLLPPLAPAYGEIPPTFWERYGTFSFIVGCALLVLAGVLIWLRPRPQPPILPPPAARARERLAPLLQTPETAAVLDDVSRVLRHYLIGAYRLPAGEVTTGEFCAALAASPRIAPGPAQAIAGLLRECDEQKFSPARTPVPLQAARRAWECIEALEPAAADPAPPASPQ